MLYILEIYIDNIYIYIGKSIELIPSVLRSIIVEEEQLCFGILLEFVDS